LLNYFLNVPDSKDESDQSEACKPPELTAGFDCVNLVLAPIHIYTIHP